MVDNISGGVSQASYTTIDLEEELKNQMLHLQPESQRELVGAVSFTDKSGDGGSSGVVGDALGAFENVMLRSNKDGSPLDARGITGEETFGNVIGDSPVTIAEDGIRQNERMGYIPNEGVKAHLLKNGV